MQLRYYQREAIDATWRYLRERTGNPCIVIPTGGGKTPVLATLSRDAVKNWGGRVLIVAHVKELLEQSIEKLAACAPDVEVGAFSAGLKRKETEADVIVAGIQSVYRNAFDLGRRDIVLIDEAHLIPPEGEGRYRAFLADLVAANPHVRLIGLTATAYRMGTGAICGPDNLLNEICYEVGVRELILRGYLAPLHSKPGLACDTSKLGTRGGEFIEGEAADLMIATVDAALDQLVAKAADRRSILVFATGIDHANRIAEGIRRRTGERAEVVDGKTPDGVRARLVREFKSESGGLYSEPLRWLVNVGVFTTGFDAPNVDCVALLRPTMSPGLYYQMVGRGFRLCDGKSDCLVLDFGGNVERHGPVDELTVDGSRKGKGGEAPVKQCPQCGEYSGVAFCVCIHCGYTWPPPDPKPKHEATATDAAITTLDIVDEEIEIRDVAYAVHTKKDADETAPKTMRVEYYHADDLRNRTSEWICIEHGAGFAKENARRWWQRRSAAPMPESAAAAVAIAKAGGLAQTTSITVRQIPGKKFPTLKGYTLGPVPPAPEILDIVDRVIVRFGDDGQLTLSDLIATFPDDAPDETAAERILGDIVSKYGWEWAEFETNGFATERGIAFASALSIPDDDVPF